MARFIFYISVVFSLIYFSGISPLYSFAYHSSALSLFLLVMMVLHTGVVVMRGGQFIAVALLAFILIFHDGSYHIGSFFSIVVGLSMYILLPSIMNTIPIYELKKGVLCLAALTICVCTIDLSHRLLNPIDFDGMAYSGGFKDFYPYKRNSLMFTDSNFTGVLLLSLIGLLIGLQKSTGIKFSYFIFAGLFSLLVFTFSRASLIALIILLYLNFFRIKLFSMCVFAFLFLIVVWLGVELDGSFQSKLWIFRETYSYLLQVEMVDLIVGKGIGASEYALGVGAHNILVLWFVEYGLLGSALFVCLFGFSVLGKGSYSKYLVLPLAVNGFSLGFLLPFIFIFLVVLEEGEGRCVS